MKAMKMAAAIAVCAWLMLPAAASANLLANPGFEEPDASGGGVTTVPGWNMFNVPELSWVTQGEVPAHSGLQTLKLFGPWNEWGGVGGTQAFPAAPGQVWDAGIWSYNLSTDAMGPGNFCVMKVEFLDAAMQPTGGAFVPGVNVFETTIADENSPVDIWREFTLQTAPAPADTAFAQYVLVEIQGPPVTGGAVFLDDAYFVPEPTSLALLGVGALAAVRRRRSSR